MPDEEIRENDSNPSPVKGGQSRKMTDDNLQLNSSKDQACLASEDKLDRLKVPVISSSS